MTVVMTRVRVDSEASEAFEVKVVMHKGSGLSPFLSTIVTELATKGG